MSHLLCTQFKEIFVAGGGHGIGYSFAKTILNQNRSVRVHVSYRNKDKAADLFKLAELYPARLLTYSLDATSPQDYEKTALRLKSLTDKLSGVINCIGYLHDSAVQPEKKLLDVEFDNVLNAFTVNSLPSLLFAKHLMPFLKHKSPSVFVCLSARVGSISENRSGGWYSYRASKAAMNMFIKNISLEYKRYGCNTLVLGLHPGTTLTELSRPFVAQTKYKLHSPDETAVNLIEVIESKKIGDTGGFFDWQGKSVLW